MLFWSLLQNIATFGPKISYTVLYHNNGGHFGYEVSDQGQIITVLMAKFDGGLDKSTYPSVPWLNYGFISPSANFCGIGEHP